MQCLKKKNMEGEYYKTKASVEEYVRLAKDVNGKELIEKLQRVLPPGSSLLEIGSGPGTDWKILSRLYEVIGSDNSTEFLSYLINKHPDGTFLELDAVTLATDRRFNGLYSNKVLHHLTDAELTASVKRQHEVLSADGVICHSFWWGEGAEVFKGLYVNYHTEATLEEGFGSYFRILTIERYREFDEDDSLLLIARRK